MREELQKVWGQQSGQPSAKGPHRLMLRGKTGCSLSSQLDQAIDLADFWSYHSTKSINLSFKTYASRFPCTTKEKIKMQSCNILCGWIAQVLKMLNIRNEWFLLKWISLASGLYVTVTGATVLLERRKWQPKSAKEGWRTDCKNVSRLLTLNYQQRRSKQKSINSCYEGCWWCLRPTNCLLKKMTTDLRWPFFISFSLQLLYWSVYVYSCACAHK